MRTTGVPLLPRCLAAAVALLAVLAAGCGKSPSPATPAQAPPLVIQRDMARAAEASIGIEGGRLEATAADGTRFVLIVPAGALPGETRIRAVPAQLPTLGAPAHAVMFEPNGLQFFDWVRLEVHPSQPIPPERRFAFGIDDGGRSVVASHTDPKAPAPTLLLDHYSGYGLADATDAQRATMLQRQAETAKERLQSRMALELGKARRRALLGVADAGTVGDLFEAHREEYEREVLAPLLEAAGGSCAAQTRALQEVLGYERQRQLLGIESGSSLIDANAILTQALSRNGDACEKEAIAQCKAAKDPTILMRFWIGRARQRALLGAGDANENLLESAKRARKICIGAQAWEIHGTVDSKPGGITLDGNACSLEEPFRVRSNGDLIGTIVFTPKGAESGRWRYDGVVGNTPEFRVDGSGDYTASEDDSGESGEIRLDWRLTIHIPMIGNRTNGSEVTLKLTPAAPCN